MARNEATDYRVLRASFRGAPKARARNPYSLTVVMDSGFLAALGPGMTRTLAPHGAE
jgi:hypothetical protein